MTGKPGRSGRRPGLSKQQLLRIAVFLALGDAFQAFGAHSRAALVTAQHSPAVDQELLRVATALRTRRRIPWVSGSRESARRAVIAGAKRAATGNLPGEQLGFVNRVRLAARGLFDPRTMDKSSAELLKLGLPDSDLELLREIGARVDGARGQVQFSRGILITNIARALAVASSIAPIRTARTSPMIKFSPAILELSETLAAVSRNRPALAILRTLPRLTVSEGMLNLAAIARGLPRPGVVPKPSPPLAEALIELRTRAKTLRALTTCTKPEN
jgi:hypothetical protein